MEKMYTLSSEEANVGRTLWNNLVRGQQTGTLEEFQEYKRINSSATSCCFLYGDSAEIIVTHPNMVKIKAKNEHDFRKAESNLKEICEGKGVPLVDSN